MKHAQRQEAILEKVRLQTKAQQAAHRRLVLFRSLIIFMVLGSLLFLAYYWRSGKLQFLGHPTSVTKATVVDTHMRHIGRGYYYQVVKYTFKYEGETYEGQFEATKRSGRHQVEDQLQIKFSTLDPTRSLRIATYR